MSRLAASNREALSFSFRWPVVPDLAWTESAFLGAFHPTRAIELDLADAPGAPPLRRLDGDHWFLVGTESPVHPNGDGLVHRAGEGGVAFRGYLTDPAIHSYSSSSAVTEHWLAESERPYNGVFSAAVLDEARSRASLTTDAFGLGPLYFRVHEGALLFASNSRLLALPGDEPDLIAWRAVIECGSIASDRSLSRDVRRVPAGATVSIDPSGVRTWSWFDLGRLPRGERALDDAGVREVEECFHEAVSRCLRLDNGRVLVPLSSGFDSRRIFGDLHRRGVEFEAITARVFQKHDRDLDARFAAQIAADHGVPHTIVEPVGVEDFAAHDAIRQQLVDWESRSHTWVIQFSGALPREPSLVFDGVLGDVLGNPGFRMPGLYESGERDLELILDAMFGGEYDRTFAPDGWPEHAAVREDTAQYLRPWMDRVNMVEFAFLLLRQRRMTSSWSQQLLPGGHVAVNPYADLDYLSLLLEFAPASKHAMPLQRECLRRFWPDLLRFPGNRDIPADSQPVAVRYGEQTALASDRAMRKRLGRRGVAAAARRCSRSGRVLFRLSQWSDTVALRCRWFLQPFMGFALRERQRDGVWRIVARARDDRPEVNGAAS